ncbi:hypothetical protein WAI453_000627 [Rhynchosporium graminicola]
MISIHTLIDVKAIYLTILYIHRVTTGASLKREIGIRLRKQFPQFGRSKMVSPYRKEYVLYWKDGKSLDDQERLVDDVIQSLEMLYLLVVEADGSRSIPFEVKCDGFLRR